MLKMTNIQDLFAPKATDIAYTQEDQLIISNICRMDSYKNSHPFAYKKGIKAMTSYGTARVPFATTIVAFGMQMLTKKYLSQRITMAHVDGAEAFTEAHFGRKLFDRKAWEKVVNVYDGFIPVVIRTMKEGTPTPGGLPLYSVSCFDQDVFWMGSAFETLILRGFWYPTTIASMDREIKIDIKKIYVDTGADLNMLPFALHDFGGRGVTCGEQAEIGGAAHTVNFMGSDTIEGILAANFYYKEKMAAFSVYATEHSVECSFGLGSEQEIEYILQQLRSAKSLGLKIVSIVIDGKDTMRAVDAICSPRIRDEIIASGVKVVLRPDSGDMHVIVPAILHKLEKAFGSDTNAQGFRKIRYVGVLQGDGVDHLAIRSLLGKMMVYGWTADNVLFGSGGALLQKVNRDTFKFAQKASAALMEVDGVDTWIGMAKDPVTDPGKKSEEGVRTTVRHTGTNIMFSYDLLQGPIEAPFEDMHQLVYHTGTLYNETTLAEVRERAAV